MIILCEGHDASGKTTISKELSRLIEYPYFKYKWTTKNTITNKDVHELVNYVVCDYSLRLLHISNTNIIIDRHYPSEWVYGSTYRNLDIKTLDNIDQFFSKINGILVICYKTEIKTKINEFLSINEIEKIRNKYFEFGKYTKCKNILFLDTTDENLEEQTKKIIEYARSVSRST